MGHWKLIAEKEGREPFVFRYRDHGEFIADVAHFAEGGWVVHPSEERQGCLASGVSWQSVWN